MKKCAICSPFKYDSKFGHFLFDTFKAFGLVLLAGGTVMGLPFLDPLAGLLVSGMILKAGYETGYQR